MSAVGYRGLHLTHHRYAHTEGDPEYRLMSGCIRSAPGMAWLLMPVAGIVAANLWPFSGTWRHAGRASAELLGSVVLHATLIALLGSTYATFVLLPMITSLYAVVALRSLCEHHGLPAGATRSVVTWGWVSFLWSNANYHLEHHRAPAAPYHLLPEVRKLGSEQDAIARGYLATGLRLFAEPAHFGGTTPRSLAFRIQVRWFLDILAIPAARLYLWNLFYTGEAYVELHPSAVYVDRLEPKLGKLLHRHAEVFRDILAAEGAIPEPVPVEVDVGFAGLVRAVPDVVAGQGPMTDDETARYMGYLHLLERRSITDLQALIAAVRQRGEGALAERLDGLLKDERFHATYTRRAVLGLSASPRDAWALLARIRRVERDSYTTAMGRVLATLDALGARPKDLGGRVRWAILSRAVALGVAFPLLPVDRGV
jgi:hypothetical protein